MEVFLGWFTGLDKGSVLLGRIVKLWWVSGNSLNEGMRRGVDQGVDMGVDVMRCDDK